MGSNRSAGWARGAILLALALLLTVSGACTLQAQPSQSDSSQANDLAELQRRLVAQETRVAALQAQNNALQTAVAKLGQASTPTPVAPVAVLPTPAPLPVVAGFPVSGTTKGAADAKVTLTAYMDYL